MTPNIRNPLSALRHASAVLGTLLLLATQATQAADLADAEVRKIDAPQTKVTLKHGEIKNLDMPPMTMVFKVKDAALLKDLKVGDKIKFAAEKIEGQYTVTRVEKPEAAK